MHITTPESGEKCRRRSKGRGKKRQGRDQHVEIDAFQKHLSHSTSIFVYNLYSWPSVCYRPVAIISDRKRYLIHTLMTQHLPACQHITPFLDPCNRQSSTTRTNIAILHPSNSLACRICYRTTIKAIDSASICPLHFSSSRNSSIASSTAEPTGRGC